jgi:hypothetical protein
MSVSSKTVYLLSGQTKDFKLGEQVNGSITSCIVIAESIGEVYERLAENWPGFSVLGFATLHDYESAAVSIRASLADVSIRHSLSDVSHVFPVVGPVASVVG